MFNPIDAIMLHFDWEYMMIHGIKRLFKIDEYYSVDFTVIHVDVPVISGFEQTCCGRT